MLTDDQGRLWWSTSDACDQLRIRPHQLWDWVRRSRKARAREVESGTTDPFPLVAAPIRIGQFAWYDADQLLEVEAYTRRSTRGRKRAA